MQKSNRSKELGKVQQKAAQYIAYSIIAVQKKWADMMGRLMSRLSAKGQRIVLLLIGVVMFISSAHLIYSGLTAPNKHRSIIPSISKIRPLENLPVPDDGPASDGGTDRKKLLEYVDSLQKSGGPDWELVNKRFPGLIDSLKALN